jgi:hypothetical protein
MKGWYMGYKPRHKLVEAVASLPLKTKTALVVLMAGCAVFGGVALGGVSNASINNGHVITSNGEAGWFTWDGNRFDEVHADVKTTTAAEQIPSSSNPATLGNGVALCANLGTTGEAAQIGEVWNSVEHAFNVVWGEGTLQPTSPNTNGNPCTDGGAVVPASDFTFTSTGVTCTPSSGVIDCGSLSFQNGDVPEGDNVYLQVRQWNTHFQFEAEDLTTGLGSSADGKTSPFGEGVYAHFAQAGTTFDTTGYSAPASNPEAYFCWVRASVTTTGEGETQGSYFDTWASQTVVSTPSGTVADGPLVAPTGMNPHVPGGLGCFTLDVGNPTGA